MKRDIRNVAASKRERLANRARARGDAFDLVTRRFFFERFLYRLGISPVANRFVLKGAMLFQLLADQPYRATVDLDLLRRRGAGTEDLPAEVRSILAQTVEPDDGVRFDPSSLTSEPIRAQDEYAGTRLHFAARLGVIVDRLQVDVGSADSVWPPPQTMTYPPLLDDPAPHVLAYRRETVIAEKSEAMLTLGIRNSRMKDFFDIHYLATHFDFDGDTLCEALRRTLSRRQTLVPNEPPMP